MSANIIAEHINALDTDFKATSLVATLLDEWQLAEDMVEIIPNGPDRSSYAKEIAGVESYYSDTLMRERLLVRINREGLYDMLPEALFHKVPKYKEQLTKEEMMSDIRERREEEKLARAFFMPFEAALNRMRTLLVLYENRLDRKSANMSLASLFLPLWPELVDLNEEQRIIWMHMMPLIPHKRNDLFFLESVINTLFNVQAAVSYDTECMVNVPIPSLQQGVLGKGCLAIDTFLGRSFSDIDVCVNICIGPEPVDKLLAFLPHRQNRKILQVLCGYLLAMDCKWDLTFSFLSNEQIAFLGGDNKHAVLGYTTHLQ